MQNETHANYFAHYTVILSFSFSFFFFALLINVFKCYNCNFSPVNVHAYKKAHKLQSNFDEYINNIDIRFKMSNFLSLHNKYKKNSSFTLYLLPTLIYEQLKSFYYVRGGNLIL